MALPRSSRVRLVWGLELALGLELYACAVLALHARGLRATPLEASLALVLPALVIPPVFYVLVGLVSMRPLSTLSILGAAAAMCGLHALLVVATGALFMIPDLLDYGAAVAFALWGSPAVTLLQLTAAPLVFARLKPLLSPRATRGEARTVLAQSRAEAPAILGAPRPLGGPTADAAAATRAAIAQQREQAAAAQAQARPPAAPAVVSAPAIEPSAAPASRMVLSPAPAGQALAPPSSTPVAVPSSASIAPSVVTVPAPRPSPIVGAAAPRSAVSTPTESAPSAALPKGALDWTEPMIRVPFARVAEQLPIEMFARGREGLNDTLRPGVSLLVPRNLLLPHLGEGLAPVKWEVVADQFHLDELVLTHEEIADRLPDGSLLLPLDEVVPQIPSALLALQTPPADIHDIEEFPVPFQPHAPASPEATATDVEETLEPDVAEVEETCEPEAVEETEPELQPETEKGPEPEFELGPVAAAGSEPQTSRELVTTVAELESLTDEVPANAATADVAADNVQAKAAEHEAAVAAESGRSEQARRIVTLLAPVLNGLEIGQRAGGGTTLVTVVTPTLNEESVVRTAARMVPFLADSRLPEPVTQATLTATEATVVLTPFGSPAAAAIVLTAVTSRASLAWLERLSRNAALEVQLSTGNGKHALRSEPGAGIELRVANVPATVRELAGSLTAFGPVAPTLLRDHAGELSACLFLPSSLDALPLARFARDLHLALEDAEVGRVASVILKLGVHRLVLRTIDGVSGSVTMLVGVGRIERPGLARIELDRAASRLGALVRS
jgi:hypothetical protein